MRYQTFNVFNAENVDGKGWFISLGTNPKIVKVEGTNEAGHTKVIRSNGEVASGFFVGSTGLRSYSCPAVLVSDCVDQNGMVIKPVKLAKLFKQYFPKMFYTGNARYWKAYNKNFN